MNSFDREINAQNAVLSTSMTASFDKHIFRNQN